MKLINNISRLLLVGIAITSLNSCENMGDDLLTQQNPNKITTQTFWQNLDDCDRGLTAVYKTFSDQNIYQNWQESLRADLGWPGVYPGWTAANSVFYTQTFNDASDEVGRRWSALYTGIFRANQVIEALEENLSAESSTPRWRQIMGQARFFRGLFHFYLNIAFNDGNVPIMRSAPASIDEFLQPSSASHLVKEFYRADLEYAESVLPEVGSEDAWTRENGDMGRVTSGAASAVLGTSYLYDEDYETARNYFEKIINNSAYSLAPTCQDNFGLLNEFNTESILEVNYTTDFNTEYGQWDWQNLTNTLNLNFGSSGGDAWGSIFASYWLYRDFVYEPVDKRNPDNKVYLPCDEHGDILYYGKKVITSSSSGGKNYNSYLVLPRDSVKKNNMTFYMKKVEVDANGNSVVSDLSTLSETEKKELYTNTSSAPFPIRAYSNMSAEALITVNGVAQQTGECWNVYFDGDKPYRYKVHSDRASSSIVMPTEWDKPYYLNDMSPNEVWPFSNATNCFRKFSNWETMATEKSASPQMRSAINNRIIRLADIYLMYAEALIEGGSNDGGVNEALKYINRVRKRAGTILIGHESVGEFIGECTYQDSSDPDVYTLEGAEDYTNLYRRVGESYVVETAQQVMDHLMYKERPLELCTEGYSIRFTDLRRWGILKERFTELASKPFYLYGFQYYKTNQSPAASTNHWNWALDDGSALPSSVVHYEYKDAAATYNDSKAYLPIPNSETSANPEVHNVIGL